MNFVLIISFLLIAFLLSMIHQKFTAYSPHEGHVSFLTLARVPFPTSLGGDVRKSLDLRPIAKELVPNIKRYRAPGAGAWALHEGRRLRGDRGEVEEEEDEEGESRTSWSREGISEAEPL